MDRMPPKNLADLLPIDHADTVKHRPTVDVYLPEPNPTRRDDSRDHAKLLAATVFLLLKDTSGVTGSTIEQVECLGRALKGLDAAAEALVAYINARNAGK